MPIVFEPHFGADAGITEPGCVGWKAAAAAAMATVPPGLVTEGSATSSSFSLPWLPGIECDPDPHK